MAYWMLVTRETVSSPKDITTKVWAPQFGDKMRAVVVQERIDSYSHYKRVDWRIIRADSARRSDCEKAIALLERLAAD